MQRTTKRHVLVLKLNPVDKIFGDRERIGQVITNLVSNAIKYCPDQKDIIISSSADHGEGVVTVQDQGLGIAKDMQDKIFDRFVRVGTGKTGNAYSGLGLGLYISAEIIRRRRSHRSATTPPWKPNTSAGMLSASRTAITPTGPAATSANHISAMYWNASPSSLTATAA
jgi:signal transduction histidine kinase